MMYLKLALSFVFGLFPFVIPLVLAYFLIRWRIPKGLTLFIGVPGSGKTTLCARAKVLHNRTLRRKKHKLGDNFYCNVPILGAYQISPQDLGHNLIENGVVVFDESGVDFNNRAYKSLSQSVIKWAKYYRHYGIKSFMMFSQGMDIDITFVRLADRIGIVTKSIIPYFIQVRYARKVVGIDDISHQLIDMYKWRLFGRKLIFAPTCWKYFDTYETPLLNEAKFPIFDYKTRWDLKSQNNENVDTNTST